MSNFALFLLIVLLNCKLDSGIFLQGTKIKRGQFPWLVQFKTVIPCGGVLISSEWILTAAQCVQSDRQSILIQAAGLNGTESLRVMNTYIFPEFKYDFNNQNPNNNIALVKLVKPFDVDESKFHFLDIGRRKIDENYKICYIFGWLSYVEPSKKVLSKPVQYSQIVLNSWQYCAYMYKGNASFLNVFCTMVESRGERMACAGNPGTPVVCENEKQRMVLLGIASWTKFSLDCGDSPSYLNVNMFRDWMYKVLVNDSKNSKTKIQNCNEVKGEIDVNNLENNSDPFELKNQFSEEDVSKILSEAKNLNILNVKKKSLIVDSKSSKMSHKNVSILDNVNDYTMIANQDLFIGGVKEREESLGQYQQVGSNKEPCLKEINEKKQENTRNTRKSKIKKANLDESDDLLPFTNEKYHSSAFSPFINISSFRYVLTILSLLFTYFVFIL